MKAKKAPEQNSGKKANFHEQAEKREYKNRVFSVGDSVSGVDVFGNKVSGKVIGFTDTRKDCVTIKTQGGAEIVALIKKIQKVDSGNKNPVQVEGRFNRRLGILAANAKGHSGEKSAENKPSIGDKITGTNMEDQEISGTVTAVGKDGVTIDGKHQILHGQIKPGEGKKEKSLKYVDPASFSAGEWKKQWDDSRATPDEKGFDYILESFGAAGQEIAEKIRETEEKLSGRPMTIQKYRVSGEGESARYTDEREKLHGRIMQELLAPDKMRAALPPPGEKPTFMILGGRGGSGKSWFKGNVYDPSKFVILDADEIKSKLPEFEGWNAQDVHEESSDILEQMLTSCIRNGLNVVFDGTMKTATSALSKVFRMKASGYRTEAHYMHLPRQEAAKRAIGRFKNGGKEGANGEAPESFTGRYVPVNIILGNTSNEDSFDQVKGLVDTWSFRDNNVEKRGDPPVLISAGEKAVKKSFSDLVKKIAKRL